MSFYRFSKEGEADVYADGPDGYPGWDVEQVDRLPMAHETREGGEWVTDWTAIDAELHARIDREAGEMRCRFITDVPGQELTYQRKEREARAWLEAETPVLSDFPFLAAESAAIDADPAVAAAEVIAAADQWAAIGSAIEGARIGAKRAVSAATTREAKELAAEVDWDDAITP